MRNVENCDEKWKNKQKILEIKTKNVYNKNRHKRIPIRRKNALPTICVVINSWLDRKNALPTVRVVINSWFEENFLNFSLGSFLFLINS